MKYGLGWQHPGHPHRGPGGGERGRHDPHGGDPRFGYITPFFSYAFYQRGPWEVSIPVQLGFGSGSLVYDDLEGTTRTLDRTFVFLEPAMTVQYRFLKYLAIGGGLGSAWSSPAA